jgi:hypothetical protein
VSIVIGKGNKKRNVNKKKCCNMGRRHIVDPINVTKKKKKKKKRINQLIAKLYA